MRSFARGLWVILAVAPVQAADIVSIKQNYNSIELKIEFSDLELLESSENPEWSVPSLGRLPMSDRAGSPELPYWTQDIQVPQDAGNFRITTEVLSDFSVSAAKPQPSKGDFTRSDNPADFPRIEGAVYGTTSVFPSQQEELSDSFQLRDARGVRIKFFPLQYDFGVQAYRFSKKVKFVVQFDRNEDSAFRSFSEIEGRDVSFEKIYQHHFVNFDQIKKRERSGIRSFRSEEAEAFANYRILDSGRQLIVIPQEWESKMSAYRRWKEVLGYRSQVFSFDPEEIDYHQIKKEIRQAYDFQNISHVLLVGDAEITPYHPGKSGNAWGNEADPMYSLVDGEDSYPDLFISRLSVKTEEELDVVLYKLLAYEQRPAAWGDWYSRNLAIASEEGAWSGLKDYERMDLLIEMLESWHYDQSDRVYEPNDNRESVKRSLEQGVGFVNYIGHGSQRSWSTSRFSNSDIDQLANSWMTPFIVSVACVNGDFDSTWSDAFAEKWLKAGSVGDPRGAVAVFASSTNQSWIPPTVGQKRISELLTQEVYSSVGALFFHGSIAVLQDGSSSAQQTFETWHIFGDSTTQVRTKAPQAIYLDARSEISSNAFGVWFKTEPYTRVSVFSGGDLYTTTVASERGLVGIPFEDPRISRQDYFDVYLSGVNKALKQHRIYFKE